MPRISAPRRSRPCKPPRPQAQRGVVLIITLIVLVLVTVLSLASIRATATDERIAGNARDRNKAFQSAEAVVLRCLDAVRNNTYTATKLEPATVGEENWKLEENWTSATNSVAAAFTDDELEEAGLVEQPRCIVEKLNATGTSVRVTGRAAGRSVDSRVVLQATFSSE
jgi:type IV pilus assembly protein PilX